MPKIFFKLTVKILNQKIIESQTNLKNILQKIKAEMEDRARGKVRYVKKAQAYQDLIDLLKEIAKGI